MEIQGILQQGLEAYGLAGRTRPGAVHSLDAYCRLLLEKNREMNLTAITDPVEAANLHMLDCAALLGCADFDGEKTLIDVGTGAGFPGVVLNGWTGWGGCAARWGWTASPPSTPAPRRPGTTPSSGNNSTTPPHGPWPAWMCCANCACPSSHLGAHSWP